ncbi:MULTISPECIES: hypothetical protein [Hyphomicrobium]|uniref:Uncharacterized protein n=1 Tax=Hyphomicrobium sulfonivorans TaxID=121290 RepID=A0A109BI73_HYPSL|nr:MULTISPECIES: hypothetical protein [Hyphomicrobium]KWT68477.1 hypothetical protein APY04_1803 [Hyphomicrobium sulfonivorans]MBI1650096.1 hypothetical protein [Hyphomicrobium sulfonivorans]MDH4982767.1 hypothetical protein [Hyphomicrobium sp. D-2]NSL73013.1 hypothetical protein [Hyphomicrobium sulfonivorans]
MNLDRRRRFPVLLIVFVPLAPVGCTGPNVTTGGASSGLTCVDDSSDCIAKRQRTLRHLVDDHDRAWLRAPAPPEAYASGVRLFALKSKKKELSCEELAHGKNEADRAPGVLRGANNLTPAQVSRGMMLATEVSRELGAEMKRRCRRG